MSTAPAGNSTRELRYENCTRIESGEIESGEIESSEIESSEVESSEVESSEVESGEYEHFNGHNRLYIFYPHHDTR